MGSALAKERQDVTPELAAGIVPFLRCGGGRSGYPEDMDRQPIAGSAGTPRSNHVRPDDALLIRLPGLLLGVGLGGFVDGIVLHQILQWHHLLSSTDSDHIGLPFVSTDAVVGLRVNVLFDGLFHAFTWIAVVAGLALLWSRLRDSRGRVWTSRTLWGWVLVGWGLFNLVEGVLSHHVLGVHHVRSGPHQLWWDLGFLAFGALLGCSGLLLQARSAPTRHPAAKA